MHLKMHVKGGPSSEGASANSSVTHTLSVDSISLNYVGFFLLSATVALGAVSRPCFEVRISSAFRRLHMSFQTSYTSRAGYVPLTLCMLFQSAVAYM